MSEKRSEEHRVLRGGSWHYSATTSSAAYRSGYGTPFRYYSAGFRVVAGPRKKENR